MKIPTLNSISGVLSLILLLGTSHSQASCGSGSGSTTITAIPTLGGFYSQVDAVNPSGQMAGLSYISGDAALHGFLLSSNGIADIGTLGGVFSEGIAINASGVIAGFADNALWETHAIKYEAGMLTDLGTLGGSFSIANAINNAGVIVGNSFTAGDARSEAFIYTNGMMTNVGTLGGSSSSAVAINQSGSIAGNSATSDDSEHHAFLYQNGVLTDLGTLGGDYSSAAALSDLNVVVGESSLANSDVHAFAFQNGTMADLGTFGGTYSSAWGVNTNGQIIGEASTAGDAQTHGFVYSAGVLTDLGTLGGGYCSPAAINNDGKVVGSSQTATDAYHAFLWQDGTMTDLNTLLPANSGWVLSDARFITDAGLIVGVGELNGEFTSFKLQLGSAANQAPFAVATAPTTVECGSLILLDGSTSSDPDGDSLTYEWSSGGTVFSTNAMLSTSAALGSYAITLKVTDPCGATSQANVSVNVVDTTAPSVVCPGQLELSANANCQASLPDLTSLVSIADGCTAANSLTVSQSPVAGTLLGKGQHTITVTVSDPSGNSGSCNATVLVKDSTAPVIGSAPATLTVAANAQCNGAVPDVTGSIVASDNCTAANALSVIQSPAAGTQVSSGAHTITVTVTDAAGNSSTTTVTLTVVDLTAPSIASAPSTLNISVGPNCQAQVPNVIASVVASDNCTPANALTITQSPAAGDVVSAGTYTITVTVTDASGNSASKNISLVVADTTAPAVVTVSATPNQLTPPNHQMVPVTVSVNATDNCDPSPVSEIVSITANEAISAGDIQITSALTCSLASSKNSTGTERVYTIHIRTHDASGNEATGSVNVRVLKSNGNGNGNGNKP